MSGKIKEKIFSLKNIPKIVKDIAAVITAIGVITGALITCSSFNGSKITLHDIDTIEDLDYLDSNYLYYAIPEVMYIIEKNIKNILK